MARALAKSEPKPSSCLCGCGRIPVKPRSRYCHGHYWKGRPKKPWGPEARERARLKNSGSGNPFFGRTHTPETKTKISAIQRDLWKQGFYSFVPPPSYGDQNHSRRPEIRALISRRVKETHWDASLEKNPNWKGGVSFLPYKPYRHLRPLLGQRDGVRCFLHFAGNCCPGLTIHHIDHNKLNNSLLNLVLLCPRYNSLCANGDREYWTLLIRERMTCEA